MVYRPKYKNAKGTLTDLPLEAETAVKLKYARTLEITGVLAQPQYFDGSKDIELSITAVPSSLLTGKINEEQIDKIAANKINGLIDMLYPIGSVKYTKVDINPKFSLGGVWKKEKFTEPEWKIPATTPIPLTQTYWDAGLGKSIIDIKNKVFRFAKTEDENIPMVASGIRYISPGNATDLFNIRHLLPLSNPQFTTNGIPKLVLPWQTNWDLENIVIQEDDKYYYVIVFDYFSFYDPDENTPSITNVPIRYFINCNASIQSKFEYTEEMFSYEWIRIK